MPDKMAELAKLAEANNERMQRLQPPIDPIKLLGQQLRIAINVFANEDQLVDIELNFQQFISHLLDHWEEQRTKAQLLVPNSAVVPDITGADVTGDGRQRGGLRVVN